MSLDVDAEVDGPLPRTGGRTTVEVTLDGVTKREPSCRHVVVAVDTSTSMQGEKIERARAGVERVLAKLDDEDRVSIVGFDSAVEVVLPLSRWGDLEPASVHRSVAGTGDGRYDGDLDAGGGTDIKNALTVAQSQLAGTDATATKDVILLSDGRDYHTVEEYERLASDIGDDGISIVAGGIGSAYNDEVMFALGDESGGRSHHLQTADQIDTFLAERIEEAGKVVASNPTLRVDTEAGFRVDTDEPVYLAEPQAGERQLDSDSESGSVTCDLPRLLDGERHRFSFVVLGTPKRAGLDYYALDLSVEDGRTLAAESIDVTYSDEASAGSAVEKRRRSAKIAVDIIDPDTDDARVRTAIDELEADGWTEEARRLRSELGADANTITASKALVDDE